LKLAGAVGTRAVRKEPLNRNIDLTHRIDCLEESGLIERQEDPTERRGALAF